LDLTRKQVHASVAQALAAIGAPQGLFEDGHGGASLHASPVPVRSRTAISGIEQTTSAIDGPNGSGGNATVTMTHIDDVSVSFSDRPAGPLVFDPVGTPSSSAAAVASAAVAPSSSSSSSSSPAMPVPQLHHRSSHHKLGQSAAVGSHIEEASNSLI
jgi:hypothetical protein